MKEGIFVYCYPFIDLDEYISVEQWHKTICHESVKLRSQINTGYVHISSVVDGFFYVSPHNNLNEVTVEDCALFHISELSLKPSPPVSSQPLLSWLAGENL